MPRDGCARIAAHALLIAAGAGALAAESYPELPGPTLKLGRTIWIDTCRACHTADFAGAPMVSDRKAWATRLARGRDTLYASALNGRFGPSGTMMPPRGGNPKLRDEEVKAAVDYMLALVGK